MSIASPALKQTDTTRAKTARLRQLLASPHETVYLKDVDELIESKDVCPYAIIGIWAEMVHSLQDVKIIPPGTKAILGLLAPKAELFMDEHLYGK